MENPFAILGISSETVDFLGGDEALLRDMVKRQKKQLRAVVHPEGAAPNPGAWAKIADAFNAIDPDKEESMFEYWLQKLKKPHKKNPNAKQEVDNELKRMQLENTVLQKNILLLWRTLAGTESVMYTGGEELLVAALHARAGTTIWLDDTLREQRTGKMATRAPDYVLVVQKNGSLQATTGGKQGHGGVPYPEIDTHGLRLLGGISEKMLDFISADRLKNVKGVLTNQGEIPESKSRTFPIQSIAEYVPYVRPVFGKGDFVLGYNENVDYPNFVFLGKAKFVWDGRERAITSSKEKTGNSILLVDNSGRLQMPTGAGREFETYLSLDGIAQEYGRTPKALARAAKKEKIHAVSPPTGIVFQNENGESVDVYSGQNIQRLLHSTVDARGRTKVELRQEVEASTITMFLSQIKKEHDIAKGEMYRILGSMKKKPIGSAFVQESEEKTTAGLYAVEDLEEAFNRAMTGRGAQ